MIESASRAERKRAKNRDALVGAARRLFGRNGFEATTIAAIAEAADLGFGTFYRYFADKEAILEAVLEAGRAEIDSVLLSDETTGVTAAEAITALTAAFARAIRRNHDVLSLMWQIAVKSEVRSGAQARAQRLMRERSLPVMLGTALEKIVSRGMRDGEFASGDAALQSRFLASAHMYLLSPGARDHDDEELIKTLCELELRALNPATTTARATTAHKGRNS